MGPQQATVQRAAHELDPLHIKISEGRESFLGRSAVAVVRSGRMLVGDHWVAIAERKTYHAHVEDLEEKVSELKAAIHFNHKNVVRCFGGYHEDYGAFHEVFELCVGGTAISWLRAQAESTSNPDELHLTKATLLRQIASGLNYIFSVPKPFDVDLRLKLRLKLNPNKVLMNSTDSNAIAKISGVGFLDPDADQPARMVTPSDLYFDDPFRFFHNPAICTPQSQAVYSLGLMIWEFDTLKRAFEHQLRAGVPPEMLFARISKGLRLDVGAFTTDFFRTLAQECWAEDPTMRPSIEVILNRLDQEVIRLGGTSLADERARDLEREEEGNLTFEERVTKYFVQADLVTRGRRVGKGGEGIVYQGTYQISPISSLDVAIKRFVVCRKQSEEEGEGERDEEAVVNDLCSAGKLEHEIKLMTELNHENILKCHGCFFDEDEYDPDTPTVNVILEWCGEGDLGKWLKQEGTDLTLQEKLGVYLQIARGIRHMHERGIVHSDIGLENVLVTSTVVDGAVVRIMKVCDFGLSNHFNDGCW